jgi:hypothetical protein
MQYFVKVLTVVILVIAITETSKRNQLAGAILASLPVTSIIAILWLKYENATHGDIADLSKTIFWMVLPSLLFFIVLPAMLQREYSFAISFFIACASSSSAYFILIRLLHS